MPPDQLPAVVDEEDVDFDALSFNDSRYWNHFYAADAEPAFYEWYSTEDWLPAAIEAVASRLRTQQKRTSLRIVDVGCGVSRTLFDLAEAHPEQWESLHGVDIAPAAVSFLCEQAAAPGAHAGLRFSESDALALPCFSDGCADVVLDKGCLDCFVSGDGGAAVATLLSQLARVCAPGGRVLILAVNGADVPRLLATGEIVPDPHARGAAAQQWGASKRAAVASSTALPWVQRLWVVETVACAEKHLLVCTTAPPPDGAQQPRLRCHECGRSHAHATERCACGNKLRRFALS